MFVRVRSRLGVLVSQREDRHATAGCLLSVLLLLPVFTQYYDPLYIFGVGLVYACLVVPILLSYITPIAVFHVAVGAYCFLYQWVEATVLRIVQVTKGIFYFFGQAQALYIQLESLHTMTNQVVFFMLAEKLLCPDQRFSSLYSLLFYNIIAYLKKSLKARRWSQMLDVTDNVQDYLRMTTTFVALKLGKAVVMTFVLMMFTAHFNDYEPSMSYVLVSATYFVLSEKAFEDWFCWLLQALDLDMFECLEQFWIPVILRVITAAMSVTLIVPIFTRHLVLCLVAAYTNVYVQYRELISHALFVLQLERASLAKYRVATRWEINNRDNICAVCLDPMTFARVTPCYHMFHGHCLRLCLKESNLCPLCKQEL